MDPKRFDALVHAVTTPGSRRRALSLLAGGALAALAGSSADAAHHKRRHRHDQGRTAGNDPGAGNGGAGDCAHFCQRLFAPGPDRGRCVRDAAQGRGLCVQCAAETSAVCCAMTNGVCASYAAASCCGGGCTPQCAGQACGAPDSCGGLCDGACAGAGETCSQGVCVVLPVCEPGGLTSGCALTPPTCACPTGTTCFQGTCCIASGNAADSVPNFFCCTSEELNGVCCAEPFLGTCTSDAGCCSGSCVNGGCQ